MRVYIYTYTSVCLPTFSHPHPFPSRPGPTQDTPTTTTVGSMCTLPNPEDCAFFDPSVLINPVIPPPPPGVGKPCDQGEIIIDGLFDDAWTCVKPAVGKYTFAYFDFRPDSNSTTGFSLYILNDWGFGAMDQSEDPDCFNEFRVTTGSGSEVWIVRVFVDASVEITLNGVAVQTRESVEGKKARRERERNVDLAWWMHLYRACSSCLLVCLFACLPACLTACLPGFRNRSWRILLQLVSKLPRGPSHLRVETACFHGRIQGLLQGSR